MKTKSQRTVGIATVIAALSFVAFSAVSMTGCGPQDPTDAELDRIPNVPPSSRGTEDAAFDAPATNR